MVFLHTVEIPGYSDALKREASVRDSAWIESNEIVAGVEVIPLNLRTVLLLERARNGFLVPCRFDNGAEVVAHALQVLYFARPQFRPPTLADAGIISQVFESVRRQRFMESVIRRVDYDDLVKEVREWLDEAFMDCPSGSAENVNPASHAASPAYVLDLLSSGGYHFTESEVMEMPLKKLWQLMRLAARRVHGTALANPSDDLAVKHLAKIQGRN